MTGSPGSVCLGLCSAHRPPTFSSTSSCFDLNLLLLLGVSFRASLMLAWNLGVHSDSSLLLTSKPDPPQLLLTLILNAVRMHPSFPSPAPRPKWSLLTRSDCFGLLALNAHLSRPSFGCGMSLLQHWQGLPALLLDFDEQRCPGSSCSHLILPPLGLPQPAHISPQPVFASAVPAAWSSSSLSTNRPSTSNPFSAKKPSQLSAGHRALPWCECLWNLLTTPWRGRSHMGVVIS